MFHLHTTQVSLYGEKGDNILWEYKKCFLPVQNLE